jgi:flagellar motor protein MotB
MSSRPSMSVHNLILESESVNDESWMTSYIDVFVLMTSIFVVLFMMNKPEHQAQKAATVPIKTVEPIINLSDEALLDLVQPNYAWAQKIKNTIDENALNSHVSFIENNEFSELEIRSQVLFNSGAASLSRSGEALLEKLVPVLLATEGLIFIEGHTDNQPIQSEAFASNWELAAARATEVLQFFVIEGVPKTKLRAVSFGDTKPLAANDNDSNRQKNRRVSILLQSPSH